MEEKTFCPNCGSENVGSSRFCMICGSALPTAPVATHVPGITPEKEPMVEETMPKTVENTPKEEVEAVFVATNDEPAVPEMMFEVPVAPAYPIYEREIHVERQPEPMPPKKEMTENIPAIPAKKKSRHIGAKIFAVLFAIILFATGFIPTILYPVHEMLDEDNLRSAVEKADIYKIVEDLIDGEDVGDFIVDNVHVKMQGKLNPSEKQVKKLLQNEDIKEFLADKLVDFATDIKEDNGDGELTSRDVYEFVKDNRDAISTAVGYTLRDAELELIEEQLDKDEFDISLDTVREKYPEVSEYVTFAVSDVGLYCAYGIVILFALIIFLICLKCVPVALKTVGIVFFINGGIALLIKPAFSVTAKILKGTLGKYDSLITSLGAPLLNGFVMIGLMFVCAGAAMIVINIIVSLITKLVAKIKAKRA
ncbi:MAG: zinc-ribbon domain-containing protein [Ruminococcaceae bacterium]|nr:zinc-ribbon domain-containing protein [Oscillospiraceae bacterium]